MRKVSKQKQLLNQPMFYIWFPVCYDLFIIISCFGFVYYLANLFPLIWQKVCWKVWDGLCPVNMQLFCVRFFRTRDTAVMTWYGLFEYLAYYYDWSFVYRYCSHSTKDLLRKVSENVTKRATSQHLACIINLNSLHDISWLRLERLSGYLPLVSKLQ